MKNSGSKKNSKKDIWEEDIFDSYLEEMDYLVNKYPEDLNKEELDEQKLHQLIKDLDDNWMAFRKKWQTKLDLADKVFGTAKVEKNKPGMRHIVIKSNFSDKDILDLTVKHPKD
ncbi:MAG: hypothetical protein KKD05_04020 [Candidatus Omnitrophica bacterium]|nr:hypothetical protein [Candidatus Omnitrophota bacterium]